MRGAGSEAPVKSRSPHTHPPTTPRPSVDDEFPCLGCHNLSRTGKLKWAANVTYPCSNCKRNPEAQLFDCWIAARSRGGR